MRKWGYKVKTYLPIGLFGIAGAVLRYAIGLWAQHGWPSSAFPAGTLFINLTGCLLLGWFSAWAASKPGLPNWFRTGFGTGFVGAYTTFSTFSVETLNLMQADRLELAALYLLSSLVGGLLFAGLGYGIFRLQMRGRARRVKP